MQIGTRKRMGIWRDESIIKLDYDDGCTILKIY